MLQSLPSWLDGDAASLESRHCGFVAGKIRAEATGILKKSHGKWPLSFVNMLLLMLLHRHLPKAPPPPSELEKLSFPTFHRLYNLIKFPFLLSLLIGSGGNFGTN